MGRSGRSCLAAPSAVARQLLCLSRQAFTTSATILEEKNKPTENKRNYNEFPIQSVPRAQLSLGVPRETFPGEQRVAQTPSTVATLLKKGFKSVVVERGAGVAARFSDSDYTAAGASLGSAQEAWGQNLVVKVRPPTHEQAALLKEGSTLVSMLYPAQNKDLVEKLAQQKGNVFALDCVPRISRAQVSSVVCWMSALGWFCCCPYTDHRAVFLLLLLLLPPVHGRFEQYVQYQRVQGRH